MSLIKHLDCPFWLFFFIKNLWLSVIQICSTDFLYVFLNSYLYTQIQIWILLLRETNMIGGDNFKRKNNSYIFPSLFCVILRWIKSFTIFWYHEVQFSSCGWFCHTYEGDKLNMEMPTSYDSLQVLLIGFPFIYHFKLI